MYKPFNRVNLLIRLKSLLVSKKGRITQKKAYSLLFGSVAKCGVERRRGPESHPLAEGRGPLKKQPGASLAWLRGATTNSQGLTTYSACSCLGMAGAEASPLAGGDLKVAARSSPP